MEVLCVSGLIKKQTTLVVSLRMSNLIKSVLALYMSYMSACLKLLAYCRNISEIYKV